MRRARTIRTAIAGATALLLAIPVAAFMPGIGEQAARAAAPVSTGTTIVDETFTGASVLDTAWKPGGTACLTGRASTGGAGVVPACTNSRTGPVPAIGTVPGYLQLTDTQLNQAGSVLYDRPIPATAGVQATFEQYQYGGTDADGISFFLVDGATKLATTGANGGSLGYAQKTGQNGVPGGYLGVGLDVFGNYYDDGENRGTNCPADQHSPSSSSGRIAPNVITLRGPGNGGSGYCFLGATVQPGPTVDRPISTLPGQLTGSVAVTNPQDVKRTVNVQVTPSGTPGGSRVLVDIDFTDGKGFQRVLDVPAPANVPSTYKFGFAGSTGGSTDVHLLRNIVVQSIAPLDKLQLVKQVDRTGTALPADITAGTSIPYQFVVTNAGQETVTNLTVTDPLVATITCPVTTLPPQPAPGGTVVCTGKHIVTAAEAASGSITNVAHANALTGGTTNVRSNDSSVTVPLHATLGLIKTVTTAGPYVIGQQVNYAYQVTNTGGATVASIGVTDNRVPTGGVKCDLTSLDPGQTTQCTGSTALTSAMLAANGTVTNTATAKGITPVGQSVTSPQATATIPVAADIGVTKAASTNTPLLGDPVTFTVTAHNYGPSVGTHIVISDPVPPGLTGATVTVSTGTYDQTTGRWTLPSLAVGSDATLTMTATVSTTNTISNGARVATLDQPDLNPANDAASVLLNPIEPTADISVVKRVSAPTVVLGSNVTFTVTASNAGPYDATGVQVRDTLPPGLSYVSSSGDGTFDADTGIWTVGTLPNGQGRTLTLVTHADATGAALNVAAIAASSLPDPNANNNVDTATTEVVAPTANLGITKVVDRPVIKVGGEAIYTITAGNTGPDAAPSVVVNEIIPKSPTFTLINATASVGTYDPATGVWTIGRLASGATAQLQVHIRANQAGSFNNTVSISDPAVIDPDPSQNTASAVISVDALPKQVDVGVTASAADDLVPVGQVTTITVTLTNLPTLPNGDPGGAVTNLVLHNSLPPGLELAGDPVASDGTTFDPDTGRWTIGAVAVGGTRTLTIPVRVTLPQTLIDTASVASLSETDVNDTNNDASAGVTGFLSADLSVVKTASPMTPQLGDDITYTIVVKNHGPTAAGSIQVSDPLPITTTIKSSTVSQGTFDVDQRLWSVGTLANGDSATMTIVINAAEVGTYVNTAVILGSDAADPNPSNQQSTVTVQVAGADIAVGKTVDVTRPVQGSVVTYTVTVRNLGPDGTTGVVVNDPLPAGVDFISATPSQGTYSATTGAWAVGTMASLAEETLTIKVRPTATGSITNTATVAPNPAVPDPEPANNQASATIDVQPGAPDLAVSKSVSTGTVRIGQNFSFRLAVTNIGVGTANNVVLTDKVPTAARPVSAPGCTISGQVVRCRIAALAPHTSAAFTVTVQAVTAGKFTNTVIVTSANTDPIHQNNTASSGVQVLGEEFTSPTPTPTPTPSPSATTPEPVNEPSGSGDLPTTGGPILALTVAGLVLLGVGTLLTSARRRRRHRA